MIQVQNKHTLTHIYTSQWNIQQAGSTSIGQLDVSQEALRLTLTAEQTSPCLYQNKNKTATTLAKSWLFFL